MAVTITETRSFILIIVLLQLFVGLLSVFIDNDLQEDDQCKLENGTVGVCKKVTECPSRLIEIQKGLRTGNSDGRCGFVNKIEIVCCPIQSSITTKSTRRPAEAACPPESRSLQYHIFNGEKVTSEQYPYVVALGYKNNDSGESSPIKYSCGGTLITDEHVLTAAHCVHNIQHAIPIEVRLGNESLTSTHDSVQRVPISDIITHPKFRYNINYYDIAILKLKRKIQFSRTVKPICLHTKSIDTVNITLSTYVIVLGWGTTSFESDLSNDLLSTPELSLVDKEECSKNYGQSIKLPNGVDNTMICAVDRNESRRSDSCYGDSGGPLVMLSDDGDRVIGVTAFGQTCGSKVPSVYMSVYSFLDWIEKHVWPTEESPKKKIDVSLILMSE